MHLDVWISTQRVAMTTGGPFRRPKCDSVICALTWSLPILESVVLYLFRLPRAPLMLQNFNVPTSSEHMITINLPLALINVVVFMSVSQWTFFRFLLRVVSAGIAFTLHIQEIKTIWSFVEEWMELWLISTVRGQRTYELNIGMHPLCNINRCLPSIYSFTFHCVFYHYLGRKGRKYRDFINSTFLVCKTLTLFMALKGNTPWKWVRMICICPNVRPKHSCSLLCKQWKNTVSCFVWKNTGSDICHFQVGNINCPKRKLRLNIFLTDLDWEKCLTILQCVSLLIYMINCL